MFSVKEIPITMKIRGIGTISRIAKTYTLIRENTGQRWKAEAGCYYQVSQRKCLGLSFTSPASLGRDLTDDEKKIMIELINVFEERIKNRRCSTGSINSSASDEYNYEADSEFPSKLGFSG
jgi:hypothetical protein